MEGIGLCLFWALSQMLKLRNLISPFANGGNLVCIRVKVLSSSRKKVKFYP